MATVRENRVDTAVHKHTRLIDNSAAMLDQRVREMMGAREQKIARDAARRRDGLTEDERAEFDRRVAEHLDPEAW